MCVRSVVGQDALVSTPVKVRFALERDEDGWPPAESEGLWAELVESDLYRLDNTPWFVRGVAAGDVVQAHQTRARSRRLHHAASLLTQSAMGVQRPSLLSQSEICSTKVKVHTRWVTCSRTGSAGSAG